MKNKDKAMYESPQSEIIELKLHGGIAQVSGPQSLALDPNNPFAGNTEEEWSNL